MATYTIDQFRQQVRSGMPTCKECGHQSHSLVAHLAEAHKMSAGQYRAKHPGAELVSPLVNEVLRAVGKTPFPKNTSLESVVTLAGAGSSDAFFDAIRASLKVKYDASLTPLVPEVQDFKFTENAELISMTLLTGRNYYVSGPTGCGKTEEVKQVLARLGIPTVRANMHGDVTYNSFVGMMKAGPSGTFFDEGLLPRAMRGGYPIILDEIDFTPPSISSVLFPVLEKDRVLYIAETGETLRPTKGFAVFATGNTGGKGDLDGVYTGTEVMNTAFLDRFPIKAKASYMSAADELALLTTEFPDLAEDVARKLVKLANEVRQAFMRNSLTITMSTRKLLDLAEWVKPLGLDKALQVTILNWVDGDDLNFVIEIMKRVGIRV